MKFIDEVKIKVIAGNGGNGLSSFCREKYRPFGGPDGGNGGNGGNIWAIANKNINTLINFQYSKVFKAKNGKQGGKSKCTGKNAKDILLNVPIGTLIINIKTKKIIADLTKNKQKVLLVKGGKGGIGNNNFKNSKNRSPRKKTNGKIGEQKELYLELIFLADVGLLGAPNAGKSTFISSVSNAKPKISNYPFTTLFPNLGVVNKNNKKFVIADIPGLIKGASNGKGLGIKFLRHLKRTNLLLHIIDISSNTNKNNIIKNTKNIIKELKKFSYILYKKTRWIIFNKIDIISKSKQKKIIFNFINDLKWKGPIYKISALKKIGCKNLISEIYNYISKNI